MARAHCLIALACITLSGCWVEVELFDLTPAPEELLCCEQTTSPGLEMPESKPADGGQEGGTSSPPQPALPIVTVYTISNCPPCVYCKRDVAGTKDFDWVFSDKPPKWSSGKSFPVIVWKHGKQEWYQEGWNGYARFKDRWEKSRTAAVPPPAREANRAGVGYTPLRHGSVPSRWSWPGDLRVHLTQPPHSLNPSRVARMSDRECVAWHDAWHDKRR